MSLAPRRRRVRRPPDLTSLFDVLFIVVFVALIRAAAAEHAVAEAEAAKAEPAPAPSMKSPLPLDVTKLQTQALKNVTAELAGRQPLVIRISEKGVITKIESGDQRLTLDVPLLVPDPDPTIRVAYQGDRSAQLRACRVAMLQLGLPDLSAHLVIFAPARARDDLPHALVSGLDRDLSRCLADQRAIATLVEPEQANP